MSTRAVPRWHVAVRTLNIDKDFAEFKKQLDGLWKSIFRIISVLKSVFCRWFLDCLDKYYIKKGN